MTSVYSKRALLSTPRTYFTLVLLNKGKYSGKNLEENKLFSYQKNYLKEDYFGWRKHFTFNYTWKGCTHLNISIMALMWDHRVYFRNVYIFWDRNNVEFMFLIYIFLFCFVICFLSFMVIFFFGSGAGGGGGGLSCMTYSHLFYQLFSFYLKKFKKYIYIF